MASRLSSFSEVSSSSSLSGARVDRRYNVADNEVLSVPGMPKENSSKVGWSLNLSLAQLIVSWSVIAGCLFGVFLLGFYLGRDQGISHALDSRVDNSMHLKIARVDADVAGGAALEVLKEEAKTGSFNPLILSGKVSDTLSKAGSLSKAGRAGVVPGIAARSVDKALAIEQKSARKNKKTGTNKLDLVLRSKGNKSPGVKPQSGSSTHKTLAKLVKSKETKLDSKKSKPKNMLLKTRVSALSKSSADKAEAKQLSLSKGWYVQISAEKSRSLAEKVYWRMDASGISGVIQGVKLKGKNYFRVLAGPYQKRSLAQKKLKKINSLYLTKGKPFIKQVN